MKKYKVIQCPKCGHIQATGADKGFKCFRCGKSSTIHDSSEGGLAVKVLDSFDHPRQAALFVQEFNRQNRSSKLS